MSSLSPIQQHSGRAQQQRRQQHLHYDQTNSYLIHQADEIENDGLGLDCSMHGDTTGSSFALLSGGTSYAICPSHSSSCFSSSSSSLLSVYSDKMDYFDVSSPLSFCEKKLTVATTPTSIAPPGLRYSNAQVSSPATRLSDVVQAIHEYNNNVRSTRQKQYRQQLQQQQPLQTPPPPQQQDYQQQQNKQIEPVEQQQGQHMIQQESKSTMIQQESKSTLMPTQASISVFSPDTVSLNETGTSCALAHFFAGLRQEQSSLQMNVGISNNNSIENDVEAQLQFFIVSDGAPTAQPARKNFKMRCNGSKSKLNRWDSTGSRTNLLQVHGESRRSSDTVPTLPGKRQFQVSEMKNSTWEFGKDKLVAPTRTSSSSSSSSSPSSSTTTTLNGAIMLLGQAARQNQESQTPNIRSASTSSFFQNSPQSITQTSSRFIRRDSKNDFAPSLPQRR